MNRQCMRRPCRAVLALAVLGAAAIAGADETADELRAGIVAYDSGDLPGAMAHFETAAREGSAEAQVRLAYILDQAEENEAAVDWYRAAAEQGHADGIAGLAAMYAKGEGVAKDYAKARTLFEQAAEAGHAASIRVLIASYQNGGLDVAPDARQLAYWKARQADLAGDEQ